MGGVLMPDPTAYQASKFTSWWMNIFFEGSPYFDIMASDIVSPGMILQSMVCAKLATQVQLFTFSRRWNKMGASQM
jgi:hypothetical protein